MMAPARSALGPLVGDVLRVESLGRDHLPRLLFGEVHLGVDLAGVGQHLLY